MTRKPSKPQSRRNMIEGIRLAGEEWLMFRDCPDSELTLCLNYEFSRHHSEAKKWMMWLGKKVAANPVFAASDVPEEFRRQPITQFPTRLLYTTTGRLLRVCHSFFPDTPWLSIPASFRQEQTKAFWAAEDSLSGEVTLTASGDPELMVMDLKSVMREPAFQHGFDFAVAIDWTQSNARLKERFALWLERHRPSHPQIRERRGKTSKRELLKALGAWRLTQEATVSEAQSHTQNFLPDGPLYEDASSWSRQAKLAANFMSEFDL